MTAAKAPLIPQDSLLRVPPLKVIQHTRCASKNGREWQSLQDWPEWLNETSYD
jgi:hypothetical protein